MQGSTDGGPLAFDRAAYRGHNTVKRAINLLRRNRAVATRYDKWITIFDGTTPVTSSRGWSCDLTRSKNGAQPSLRTRTPRP